MRDMKESWLGLVFPAEINSEKFNRLHDQYSEKEWSARRTSFDVPAILTAGCVLAMLLLLCAPLVEQNKTMFFWTLYIIANGFMGVVLAVFVGWVWHRRRRACRDAVSVADPLFQSRYKLLTQLWQRQRKIRRATIIIISGAPTTIVKRKTCWKDINISPERKAIHLLPDNLLKATLLLPHRFRMLKISTMTIPSTRMRPIINIILSLIVIIWS